MLQNLSEQIRFCFAKYPSGAGGTPPGAYHLPMVQGIAIDRRSEIIRETRLWV